MPARIMMQRLLYITLLVVPSLAWGGEQQPQATPTPAMADPLGATQLFQVALVLVLILLLIVALAWLMRRFGNLPVSGNSAIRTLADPDPALSFSQLAELPAAGRNSYRGARAPDYALAHALP